MNEPRWWATVGCLGVLLGLAAWAAIGYVVWHFVEKFW